MNRRHSHPCQDCGEMTPCEGSLERNYDGFPEVICDDFHHPYGINPNWVCEGCQWAREDADKALLTGAKREPVNASPRPQISEKKRA